MAGLDSGPGHLLSLKVMRVSRPTLANSWQPFYSSSPSFSAHSTTSILSLQGLTPLPGHPKTLRDLTHASELLTLPSSFGSIQLGETFSSCLCINNEAQVEIECVSVKVEMQTVTSKVMLAELGGPDFRLGVGDSLESVVHHEIKELGQHVLACLVSYRLPPNSRNAPSTSEDGSDPPLQTFRKFYKFAVTNPLSVKTKVHAARSPSALMSLTERDRVFLEVHIQNLTQEPIWFDRMRFECGEGWAAKDANLRAAEPGGQDLFSGPSALMQPQDMRQYVYILSPISVNIEPVVYPPGTIIPLGRLDLSWRSSYGEPGRLLTSMLSRRIPLPQVPVQQPASALPPYLKRNSPAVASTPPRPHSPQLPQSRPGSPTPRPGSPFRNRPPPVRSGSPTPGPSSAPSAPSAPPILDVNLIVRDVPRDTIVSDTPFNIPFTLSISTPALPDRPQRSRNVTLAVQHLQPPRAVAPLPPPIVSNPPEPYSPRLTLSGFSTPSTTSTSFNYALAHQKLLVASPRKHHLDDIDGEVTPRLVPGEAGVVLPPPFFEAHKEVKAPPKVVFHGSSALFLPPIKLTLSEESEDDDEDSTTPPTISKLRAVQDFELSYMPVQKGLASVGGLRVLLVEDNVAGDDEGTDDSEGGDGPRRVAQTLKEWNIVAEVWVA